MVEFAVRGNLADNGHATRLLRHVLNESCLQLEAIEGRRAS